MLKNNRPHKISVLNKTLWFLGGYAFFLISTISAGVYYISNNLETIHQSVLEFDELNREVETVNEYFILQAKDRKNLFLRGHNQQDRRKYLGRVNEMTENIKTKIDEILENPLAEPYRANLELFIVNHAQLMAIYRQGIAIVESTQDHTKGDDFVRGKGSQVGEELTQVLREIEADRQKLLEDNKSHIRNFLIISTSGLILMILGCSAILVIVVTNPMRRIVRFTNFLEESHQTHHANNDPDDEMRDRQSIAEYNQVYQPLEGEQEDEIGYMINTYGKLANLISKYSQTLEQKIEERNKAQENLKILNEQLETGVQQRTAELVITNQNLNRQIIEKEKSDAQVRKSLQEKELLLKEIHHRVKNNLLVVSNLLDFQADYIEDRAIIKMFENSQHRIHSMALIHEQLYNSSDLKKLNLSDYLLALVDKLSDSYETYRKGIKFLTDIEQVYLNIETAHPCGLIINELIANALEHAFPDEQPGTIWLKLKKEEPKQITLTIADDGIGFPENLDFQETESLGLQLVCTLTEQLEGAIELVRTKGTSFTLSFSELDYYERV